MLAERRLQLVDDLLDHGAVRVVEASRAVHFAAEIEELGCTSDRMSQRQHDASDRKRLKYERYRSMTSKDKPEWENPDDKEEW